MNRSYGDRAELKVGQKIKMKSEREIMWFFRTRRWMANFEGTIVNLNRKTVTVVFDAYPEEKHYVDYGDFDVI